jgi:hypothetical protein
MVAVPLPVVGAGLLAEATTLEKFQAVMVWAWAADNEAAIKAAMETICLFFIFY